MEPVRQVLLSPATEQRSSMLPVIELEAYPESIPNVLSAVTKLDKAFEAVLKVIKAKDLDLLLSNADLRVYGRLTPRGYFIKTVWQTPLPPDTVMRFIRKYEERPTWDPNLTACSLLSAVNGVSFVYQRYKKVLTVSPRDMVLGIKTYTLKDAMIDVAVSMDLPEYPVYEEAVRAQVYMGGFYAETTRDGTRVIAATEIDFGGVIPKVMMMRMSAMAMPTYIKRLMAGVQRQEVSK